MRWCLRTRERERERIYSSIEVRVRRYWSSIKALSRPYSLYMHDSNTCMQRGEKTDIQGSSLD